MENNNLTAVEWLCKEEENLFISYQKGFMSLGRYTLLKHKLFEQAKQMEKNLKDDALRAIGYIKNEDLCKLKIG